MKSAIPPTSPLTQRWPLLNQGIAQALVWAENTRLQTPRFALEAPTLMLNLRRSRIQLQRLAVAASQRGALGFYGRSQAAKNHLIASLATAEANCLATTFAGKTLDYLKHIRPGDSAVGVAIRFSHAIAQQDPDYPVQLQLLTAAELVCMVARCSHTQQAIEKTEIEELIASLTKRCQPQAVPGLGAEDIVTLWDSLRTDAPQLQQRWDSEYWPNALAIAPYLSIDDRADLFAPLWGKEPALTACYRRLAYRRDQLGGAASVLAPLSLLTNENQQPSDGILTPANLEESDDKVQLKLDNGVMTMPVAELRLLAAELLIPLQSHPAHSGFASTDYLDLPAYRADDESLSPANRRLQQAKSLTLLQRYSDQQAMQALIVCHAAASREEVTMVGQALDHWVQQHQEAGSRGHPELIWAFTPYDRRSSTHFDQAVQRYVGHPGEVWGTLLAMNEDEVRRMTDYLLTSVNVVARHNRLQQRFDRLEQELRHNLLGRWINAETEDKAHIAKATVKALQDRTTLHGELLEHLLPDRNALQPLFCQQQDRPHNDDPLAVVLDLFDEQPTAASPLESDANAVLKVQQVWITQLRNLADNRALVSLLAVDTATLTTLADELITASFRLEIWQRLGNALAEPGHAGHSQDNHVERQIACTLTVLGDFVAWLGFPLRPQAQRPESRINRGHKIFTKPSQSAELRMTALPAEPINNTALYIYDWLVGLYQLIAENAGHGGAQALSGSQREKLGQIMREMG
ncbi:virulence factor SrfC family protein [Serratia silvae]|uniref:Virulence factor n=1 Tax=Serratia silvae TaxID=2824122 RepID=A0ABT0KEV4_9GAMM|nr:virulence factor SrfC family protein [Serratia silvae]MCL1030560.1 virulence factor [Serratia silvae]